MLSQTAEYALRSIVYLSRKPDEAQTIQVIAEATEIPAGYLSKVMQQLRKEGLLSSTRGKKGGFILNRRPDQISLYEVVNAVAPFQNLSECPLKNAENCSKNLFREGTNKPLCPLHTMLHGTNESVAERFKGITLNEFLPKH